MAIAVLAGALLIVPDFSAAATADPQGFVPRPYDWGNFAPRTPPGALGGGTFDNRLLGRIAVRDRGRVRGPSKQAVNDWVRRASSGAVLLGGSYRDDYAANGAQEVPSFATARAGDIVQLTVPGSPSAYRPGMHTAIVLTSSRSASTVVVDSDWRANGRVMVHVWNPYATARRYGLAVTIWRLGSINSTPPTPTAQPDPGPAPSPLPSPATYPHRVQGTCSEGACGLRVYSSPGTNGTILNTVFDGQQVDITCQVMGEPVQGLRSTSAVWDRLATGGYVSDYYVDTPIAGGFSPPIPAC